MPGGNPTIKSEPLDLATFLERKRKPLDLWLIQNNIVSEQALQNFLKTSEWSVSEKLIQTIRSFFVVVTVPKTVEPEPVIQPEEPKKEIEPVLESPQATPEQTKVLLSEQPLVEEQQEVVVVSEEIVPPVVEPASEEEESAESRTVTNFGKGKRNR